MDNAIDLLARLVSINSVNPDLVPGGRGEGEIADFLGLWLRERGFEVHRLEAQPGRPSIVGVARGRGGGRSLMFNGHIDTVTLAGYDGDPLDPRIEAGRLHGRGAFDMKSGVAAMLVAAGRAAREGVAGDIIVACVADEEHASVGSAEVVQRFSADGAVVTEPSHLELTLAHKGFVWCDVTIEGRAAHGSRPELGIDAIVKAGHFLVALEALEAQLRQQSTHSLLGSGSLHASLISGGEERSSYPAECRIAIERRTVPGETGTTVEAELRGVLDRLTRSIPEFRSRLEMGLTRSPFEAETGSAIVSVLERQATRVRGASPKRRGEPFWTDCAILQQAGIPCLMFGAAGGGAHSAHEWADVESVHALTEILYRTAQEFCG